MHTGEHSGTYDFSSNNSQPLTPLLPLYSPYLDNGMNNLVDLCGFGGHQGAPALPHGFPFGFQVHRFSPNAGAHHNIQHQGGPTGPNGNPTSSGSNSGSADLKAKKARHR